MPRTSPAQPTGTVTFLFTDIAGSTKLWEAHYDAMRPALARHDVLLRGCIEDYGGFVFKTVGDAFCAAFATANQALDAALGAQLTLSEEPWPTPTPLLVRMALHTGAAEERDGDYFGPPVNRAARILATGHGRQILLSGATREIVHSTLPASVTLLDLGRHRLKDLGRPEQVFQLQHPGLPAGFAPIRSLDNLRLPNNLPQQPSSFIGREKQIAEVKALLAKSRLLTLTGPGGTGKTRLSLQVAADLLDGDGVWFIELAALTDPALVPQAVADVLGVKEQTGQPLQRTLAEWLKTKRLLLVLDNCEHLVAACASLAADLLKTCPGIHILASSREALNISGEQTYRVPILTLPDPKQAQTLESMNRLESVRLFTERAQAVQPLFALTGGNAAAVASVCRCLDGIPLAIELAAARVRSLSVEQINTRLGDRFRLLTGGARTVLPRQQTLRALVDWSYDLLTDTEKTLLRRLSVFAGGWTLTAAETVCSGDESEDLDVLDLLTSLLDKSLVIFDSDGETESRYRILETVRQYAGDRLQESGEAAGVQERAAAWFLLFAEEAAPLLVEPEQVSGLLRLEAEHGNLRASLVWYEQTAGAEDGLRLAGALSHFWNARGYFSEGRRWLSQALGRAKAGTTPARVRALLGAGTLACMLGDYTEARALLEEGLSGAQQLGEQRSIANAFHNLGLVASSLGSYTEAQAWYEKCLTMRRGQGDEWGTALTLSNLGYVALRKGDYAEARALNEEGLTLQRRRGDRKGIADTLNILGMVAIQQGDYPSARTLFEESLPLFRQLGNQLGVANILGNLGVTAIQQGDYESARTMVMESLTLYRELGNQHWAAYAVGTLADIAHRQGFSAQAQSLYTESLKTLRQLGDTSGIIECLEGIAQVAHAQGNLSRAAHLWGASVGQREALGTPLFPEKQRERDGEVAAARAVLGEEAYAAAWNAGRAMSWEQAVDYALNGESPPAPNNGGAETEESVP